MKKFDITILTDKRWVDPKNPDWYSDQLINEDVLVWKALEAKGLRVTRTNWDNPDFDWANTEFALFRTVWDYSERWREFDAWFSQASLQTKFINPASQIRWNLDKHYMAELESKGVNIPPTIFIDKGSTDSLAGLFAQKGWNEAVLKPTISGGARETYRLRAENASEFESKFAELIGSEDMMLQQFQNNVVERGEVSMMFAGDTITHSIIKKAKAGDFRVQDDFGGSVEHYKPTSSELDFAKNVLSACKEASTLGRVDMIWDNQGNPALGELEIIEPEMWFRFCPEAADFVAQEIFNRFF